MDSYDKKNIQNLLLGKPLEKKIQVGYRATEDNSWKDREEGEVWREDGIDWEIKNGKKQRLDRLAGVRMPMFCPRCSKLMKSKLDERSWYRYQMCSNCYIEFETELIKIDNKLYQNYTKYKALRDFVTTVGDEIDRLEFEKEKAVNGFGYALSSGETQNWTNTNPEKVISDLDTMIKSLSDRREDMKSDLDSLKDDYDKAIEIWNDYKRNPQRKGTE